ncbi:hypothetical protein D3C85_1598260 [compost metagenome]
MPPSKKPKIKKKERTTVRTSVNSVKLRKSQVVNWRMWLNNWKKDCRKNQRINLLRKQCAHFAKTCSPAFKNMNLKKKF